MLINDLKPNPGATKYKRRVGQGPGSGMGKTSARGGKGQTARRGYGRKPGFEGGQTPLFRRLPKRGFNNKRFGTVTLGMNLKDLAPHIQNGVFDGSQVNTYAEAIKLLGMGDVPAGLKTVRAVSLSESARKKLEAKGVKVE